MRARLIGALALTAAAMPLSNANAFDDSKYPGLGGQPSFDQTKPWAFGQQAPLMAEAKALLEASLADQAQGGQGNFTGMAAARSACRR